MIPTNYAEIDALYRHIVAERVRSLVVASAGSGDGATTLAYTLARRASRSGRKVLLIELNVHRPALEELLGVERVDWSPDDPDSVDAAIAHFGADGMAALAAPLVDTVSAAFREVDVLSRFIERLSGTYDFIVLDSGPVCVRNARNIPPLTVCRAVGCVLFSVMSRHTSEADVAQAAELIRGEGARILGAVVNDRDNPSLGEELEREAGRLRRLSPALVGWLHRLIRRASLLYQLP